MNQNSSQTKNSYQMATVAEKMQMYPLAVQAMAIAPRLTENITTAEDLAALIDKTAEAIWMAAEPEF